MAIRTSDDTATRWHGTEGDPVVVLAHDWNGRLPWIEELAVSLAGASFRVAVPDFHAGRTSTDDEEAAALLRERSEDLDGAFRILSETIGEARAGGSERAAVVGFSMGSTLALGYAAQGALDAVVAYYGAALPGIEAGPRTPVLFQVAESDDWSRREAPEDYRSRLAAEGFDEVEIRHHAGAVHGFQNAQIERRFDADASAAAWETTVAFLRGHLEQ
ncbi:dienelactone hydrolase family protein [Agrococcus sp. ARC_14]|uniref:dienelactone hydrolase family protein n=1 Tax=Agrococcus sp. ARC_14 TaxID=2919927 RepID=UPI001F054A33|nr:dienelactone hydrolase family protein [Agrococcus sp. ARC_14]MCH1881815.1 dienelactone hydrolase family protein [Agrococcus sp. ARC_14]